MARSLTYCRRCVLPSSKPDLFIDPDGICSACRAYDRRATVDWDARKAELLTILDRYRNPSGYDCIVPSSGGKDSHTQVLRMLEFGMTPLVVTATTDHLTDIGRRNIENLKRRGVDYIEYSANPVVRRRLNRLALEQVGDISWPEHVAIFTLPVRVAVAFNIPLIIWGENSQDEYGGPAAAQDSPVLTRRWLEEFGGLLGLRVSDLPFGPKDLIPYTYPSDDELRRAGVTGLFLGHYLPWSGLDNAILAREHGFEWFHKPVEASGWNFENLDNAQTGLHDHLKWCKFMFSRASDMASLQVRRGLMTREQAIEHVREWDGRFPWTYLDVPLEEILATLDMTIPQFQRICDRFTNRALFKRNPDGSFARRPDGSPVPASGEIWSSVEVLPGSAREYGADSRRLDAFLRA